MNARQVFLFGDWLGIGDIASVTYGPLCNKRVKSINVELNDPRNGNGSPAFVSIKFEDGILFEANARDVAVIYE